MKDSEDYRKDRTQYIWGGIGVSIVARIIAVFLPIVGIIISLAALAMIITGCYFWAKSKAQSSWWALFGLIAPIGFIPLALLKDKNQ